MFLFDLNQWRANKSKRETERELEKKIVPIIDNINKILKSGDKHTPEAKKKIFEEFKRILMIFEQTESNTL